MSLHCPPAPSYLVPSYLDVTDQPAVTGSVEQAWAALRALLDTFALFVPAPRVDVAGWDDFVEEAMRTTRRLASFGALPGNLVVEVDDAPVVVGRLLAAASRRAADLYAAPTTGRSAWESNTTADA